MSEYLSRDVVTSALISFSDAWVMPPEYLVERRPDVIGQGGLQVGFVAMPGQGMVYRAGDTLQRDAQGTVQIEQ
jgi:hypothetical protein